MHLYYFLLSSVGIFIITVMPVEAIAITTDDHTTTLVGRAIERIIIVIGGVCSLYFGFLLFRNNLEEKGDLEAKVKGFYLKLRDVGPGVFFGLFGAAILVFSTLTQVEFTYDRDTSLPIMMTAEESANTIWRQDGIQTMTALETFSKDIGPKLNSEDRQKMASVVSELKPVIQNLVNLELGDGVYEEYSKLQQLESSNPAMFNKEIANADTAFLFETVESLMRGNLGLNKS